MTALANALAASIPTDEPDNQYSITVISFSASARVDVVPTLITDGAKLSAVTTAINQAGFSGGSTNYSAAFSTLDTAVGTLNGNSIINMMTDGEPFPSSADGVAESLALRTAGWDSLSFEAVGVGPDSANLSSLAFDLNGVGGKPIFTDPTQIADPLQQAFVLEVLNFGDAYTAAISNKVQRIVNPEPISPVPVPAALPLLLAGVGMLGALRLRKSKTVAALLITSQTMSVTIRLAVRLASLFSFALFPSKRDQLLGLIDPYRKRLLNARFRKFVM